MEYLSALTLKRFIHRKEYIQYNIWKIFSLRLGIRQGAYNHISSTLYWRFYQVPWGKKNKKHKDWKGRNKTFFIYKWMCA